MVIGGLDHARVDALDWDVAEVVIGCVGFDGSEGPSVVLERSVGETEGVGDLGGEVVSMHELGHVIVLGDSSGVDVGSDGNVFDPWLSSASTLLLLLHSDGLLGAEQFGDLFED